MILKVGEPYPVLAGRGEGVFFDIDDMGAKCFICMDRPKPNELAAVQAGQPFQMKFLERDSIIWVMVKCGDLAWMDAPYDPRASLLSNSHIERPEAGRGLGLTLSLVDARDAVVKHIRLIGMDEKFSLALLEAADRLRNTPVDWAETSLKIAETMRKYQTRDLVRMASHGFRLRG